MPSSLAAEAAGGTAIGLLVLLAVCLGAGAIGIARRQSQFLAFGAVVGISFQVAHAAEHLGQVAYWLVNPASPPWMTPLGAQAHAGFTGLGFSPAVAAEAMHLLGNGIFLAGLSCLWQQACWRCEAIGPERVRWLRRAWVVESVHFLEHVALTASTGLAGRTVGISTGFGLLAPGPALWSHRVWWHFIANLIPVVLVAVAIPRRGAAPEGRLVLPPAG